MDIRSYIRHTRTTQLDFARLLGVSQALVWMWLQDPPQSRMTPEMALHIEERTNKLVRREHLLPRLYVGMRRVGAPRSKPAKRRNGSGK